MKLLTLIENQDKQKLLNVVGFRKFVNKFLKEYKKNPNAHVENDYYSFTALLDYFETGDFNNIKGSLSKMDTAPRDDVLGFIDKILWKELGFTPLK